MKRYPHLLSAGRETARATVPRAVSTAAERGRVCLNCAGARVCGGVGGVGGLGAVVNIPVTYYHCTSEVTK